MDVNLETETTRPFEPDEEHGRLLRLCGAWRGVAKTSFAPGEPPLEAAWEGNIASILGGRFVRFAYRSSLQGKPLAGEMLIAFESGEKQWRTSWVDSFHTGTVILVSTGEPGEKEIDVRASYFIAPDQPRWGWRTVVDAGRDDRLVIRMYNVLPDGQEHPGVEIALSRVVEGV